MYRRWRMQTRHDEQNRERLTNGPLGFLSRENPQYQKCQRERHSKHEGHVDKKEVRSVYRNRRIHAVRKFGTSDAGERRFHRSRSVSRKERVRIRNGKRRRVPNDGGASRKRKTLFLKLVRRPRDRRKDYKNRRCGNGKDRSPYESEISVRDIGCRYRHAAPASAHDCDSQY